MMPEQESVPSGVRDFRLVPVVAVVWAAASALYLTLPPGVDQFNHAYLGWRWIRGDAPYRDVVDMNWPGVMGLHALAAAVFGTRSWSWHALDFLLLAASAPFLFDLVRRGFGRPAAWLAALLYPLFYVGLPHDFAGQHDMTGTQFLLPALWFHVRAIEERCWKRSLAAGAFLGAAMLNKPTLGFLGPLMPLHALLVGVPLKAALVHAALAAGSSVALLALGFGAVLASGASIGDVLDAAVRYNATAQFSDHVPAWQVAARWAEVHFRWWPATVLAAAGAAAWSFRGARRTASSTALPVLWLAGVLSFSVQGKGFPYHLSPCFPATVGLAAAAIPLTGRLAAARLGPKGPLSLQALAGLVIFAAGVWKVGGQYASVPRALFTGDWMAHERRFHGGEELPFDEIRTLAAEVERSVPENETVLVVGSVSAVNLLSRRPQPTRFYYTWVLYWLDPSMPMAARWTELWRRDLETGRPRWCLIPREHFTPWMDGDKAPARVLRTFLDAGYVRARRIGQESGFDLYVRR